MKVLPRCRESLDGERGSRDEYLEIILNEPTCRDRRDVDMASTRTGESRGSCSPPTAETAAGHHHRTRADESSRRGVLSVVESHLPFTSERCTESVGEYHPRDVLQVDRERRWCPGSGENAESPAVRGICRGGIMAAP